MEGQPYLRREAGSGGAPVPGRGPAYRKERRLISGLVADLGALQGLDRRRRQERRRGRLDPQLEPEDAVFEGEAQNRAGLQPIT